MINKLLRLCARVLETLLGFIHKSRRRFMRRLMHRTMYSACDLCLRRDFCAKSRASRKSGIVVFACTDYIRKKGI